MLLVRNRLKKVPYVPKNIAPIVSLTSPTDGLTLSAPAVINLAATASDPDGSIVSVSFYRGSTLIRTVTSGTRINYALPINGGIATASSTFSAAFPPLGTINGDRNGLGWGAGGGWNNAVASTFTDYLQIDLGTPRLIDEINVFTLQDNNATSVPTLSTTFTQDGLIDFNIKYLDGQGTWQQLFTVTANNKVWRQFSTSLTAQLWRLYPTAFGSTNGSYARVVEFELVGAGSGTGSYIATDVNVPAGTYSYTAVASDGSDTTSSQPALVAVSDPPPPPPPPPPGPVTVLGRRVLISDAETTHARSNTSMFYDWTNAGGDYRDRNDVANGSNHYDSLTVSSGSSQSVVFNVKDLTTRMISDNTAFIIKKFGGGNCQIASKEATSAELAGGGHIPLLTIVTTTGTFTPSILVDTYMDPSTGSGLGTLPHLYVVSGSGALIKFDLSTVTGTVQTATLSLYMYFADFPPFTLTVDFCDTPALITDPVTQLGGAAAGLRGTVAESALAAHPSVRSYSVWDPAITPTIGWLKYNQYTTLFTYKTWPEYNIGVIRHSIGTPEGGHYGADLHIGRAFDTGPEEQYLNYPFMLDADWLAGDNTGGKLPGLVGSYLYNYPDTYGSNALYNYTQWSVDLGYEQRSPTHPDVCRIYAYYYGADRTGNEAVNPLRGDHLQCNFAAKLGQKYTIQLYIKLNTLDINTNTWNADGILIVKVDGVEVLHKTDRQYRKEAGFKFSDVPQWLVYGGGSPLPDGIMHAEMGPCIIADVDIGPIRKVEPTYMQGQALYEWKKVSTARLTDLEAQHSAAWNEQISGSGSPIRLVEGPSAIIGDWTGMSVDSRDSTIWMLANGGHNGYAGNQAIKCKLSIDSPIWEQAAPPTPASQIRLGFLVNPPPPRVNADGRPLSAHSYFYQQFSEVRNRALRFGSAAVQGDGNITVGNMVVFDPATGLYEADGANPDIPYTFPAPDGVCFKDPTTGNVYLQHNEVNMTRWNAATNDFTLISSGTFFANCAAVDTRRRRALGIATGTIGTTKYLDLVSNTYTPVTLTGSGVGGVTNVFNGCALDFVPHPTDPTLDCYYFARSVGAGIVYRVNAVTWAVDLLPTTGGSAIPAIGTGSLLYNKFRYLSQYGRIVMVAGYDDVWVLKVL